MTTEQEILWLAGLLEGEGCFSIFVRKSGATQIALLLHMTDEDVIRHAAVVLGARVYKEGRLTRTGKQVWAVRIYGDKAISAMKQILPFMGHRRQEKIEECIQAYRNRRTLSKAATIRCERDGRAVPPKPILLTQKAS